MSPIWPGERIQFLPPADFSPDFLQFWLMYHQRALPRGPVSNRAPPPTFPSHPVYFHALLVHCLQSWNRCPVRAEFPASVTSGSQRSVSNRQGKGGRRGGREERQPAPSGALGGCACATGRGGTARQKPGALWPPPATPDEFPFWKPRRSAHLGGPGYCRVACNDLLIPHWESVLGRES